MKTQGEITLKRFIDFNPKNLNTMRNIEIRLIDGKWHFNGVLYNQLFGIEKDFVDKMLGEVKIDRIALERKPNTSLKNHNYDFKFVN